MKVHREDTAIVFIDPQNEDLCNQFAKQYAELRKAKGITFEQAHETMHDVSYFGTMLVYNGMVDGMVSGAAHTTAHTVRPALEIIRTVPDVSTVSSIFLMCLPDRVLAYGDCAIVPDPTPEQLADIAISSARTAAQFGIDPKVAMLSYSTGDSGAGADVETRGLLFLCSAGPFADISSICWLFLAPSKIWDQHCSQGQRKTPSRVVARTKSGKTCPCSV